MRFTYQNHRYFLKKYPLHIQKHSIFILIHKRYIVSFAQQRYEAYVSDNISTHSYVHGSRDNSAKIHRTERAAVAEECRLQTSGCFFLDSKKHVNKTDRMKLLFVFWDRGRHVSEQKRHFKCNKNFQVNKRDDKVLLNIRGGVKLL